jgi:hypothetical protein
MGIGKKGKSRRNDKINDWDEGNRKEWAMGWGGWMMKKME